MNEQLTLDLTDSINNYSNVKLEEDSLVHCVSCKSEQRHSVVEIDNEYVIRCKNCWGGYTTLKIGKYE